MLDRSLVPHSLFLPLSVPKGWISSLLLKSKDKVLLVSLSRMFHALVLAHTEGFPQSENVTAFREVGIRLPTCRKTQFATKWGIRLPHFLSWPSHELRIRQRSCVFGACASTSRLVARNVRDDALYETRRRNVLPSSSLWGMSHEIRWEYMARFAMRCCCENPIGPLSFPVQGSTESVTKQV